MAQWGGNRSAESHPAQHVPAPKTSWLEAHAPKCTVVFQCLQCRRLFPLLWEVSRASQGVRGVKGPCAAVEGGSWSGGSRQRSQPGSAGEGAEDASVTCAGLGQEERSGWSHGVIAEPSAANIPPAPPESFLGEVFSARWPT